LFLEVDTHSIDINIHPTKTEIKFDDEHSIYAMLRATIKHSLGQFNIAPVLDFERDKGFDTPYEYSKKSPTAPSVEVDRDFNPFREKAKQGNINFPYQRDPSAGSGLTKSWESLYVGLKDGFGYAQPPDRSSSGAEMEMEFESEEVTGSLFENTNTEVGQITFQIQNKYIVSPLKNGMMIIHQNLAHQRILYEELLKNITVKEAVSQQLLFPLQLHFSNPDLEIIEKIREQLEHTGFIFSELKDETIEISGIPVLILESHVVNLLQQLVHDIKEEVPDSGFSQNDMLAKSMAESMAIKSGVSLNREEREHLINQLFACKDPSVSPNNRLVFTTMEATDLDKKFM
jgi:DNA mismatch repair protein MutL